MSCTVCLENINYISCPTCKSVIHIDCINCDPHFSESCYTCKQKFPEHILTQINYQKPENINNEGNNEENREFWNSHGLDMCPSCGVVIEKIGGCEEIQCNCGHAFEYKGTCKEEGLVVDYQELCKFLIFLISLLYFSVVIGNIVETNTELTILEHFHPITACKIRLQYIEKNLERRHEQEIQFNKDRRQVQFSNLFYELIRIDKNDTLNLINELLDNIGSPLVELTVKDARFDLTPRRVDAINEIKRRLVSAPILAHADPQHPFIIYSDASDVGVGGIE